MAEMDKSVRAITDPLDAVGNSEALAAFLAAVRHKQGKHLGEIEALGFDLRRSESMTKALEQIHGN
jgi:Na+/H+-translocating membrane pyrophosphatase